MVHVCAIVDVVVGVNVLHLLQPVVGVKGPRVVGCVRSVTGEARADVEEAGVGDGWMLVLVLGLRRIWCGVDPLFL